MNAHPSSSESGTCTTRQAGLCFGESKGDFALNTITLIATDLDGTFLDGQKNVSALNREAIRKLKEHGILFGIATGRAVESTMALCKEWGIDDSISFIAGVNGGTIYDTRTGVKENHARFDGDLILDILEYYKDMPQLHVEVMDGAICYTGWSSEHTRAVNRQFKQEEVVVDLETFLKGKQFDKLILRSLPQQQKAVAERAKTIPFTNMVSFPTSDVLYEFCDPKINKGYGLDLLCEHYGLRHEDIAAFGDESNDIEMLEKAGYGLAMKNATAPVKVVADTIIPWTNEESGVGRYIEEVILPGAQGRLDLACTKNQRKEAANGSMG